MDSPHSENDAARVIEGMVDERGLSGVLDVLSEICGEKARHIAQHWQDRAMVETWNAAAAQCNAAADAIARLGL